MFDCTSNHLRYRVTWWRYATAGLSITLMLLLTRTVVNTSFGCSKTEVNTHYVMSSARELEMVVLSVQVTVFIYNSACNGHYY